MCPAVRCEPARLHCMWITLPARAPSTFSPTGWPKRWPAKACACARYAPASPPPPSTALGESRTEPIDSAPHCPWAVQRTLKRWHRPLCGCSPMLPATQRAPFWMSPVAADAAHERALSSAFHTDPTQCTLFRGVCDAPGGSKACPDMLVTTVRTTPTPPNHLRHERDAQ